MDQRAAEQESLNAAWTSIQRSDWNQIDWFVKLLNTDLTKISQGDLLKWKEDFRAMESEQGHLTGVFQRPPTKDCRYWKPNDVPIQRLPPFPTLEDMQEVRSKVARVLSDLADGRDTKGPRIYAEYYVSFKKTSPREEERGLPRYQIMRCEIGTPLVGYCETMPIMLAHLLERHAEKVRRCLNCQQIFVQLKQTRKYCGPRCQTVAGMRELRKRRRAEESVATLRDKPKTNVARAKYVDRKGKTDPSKQKKMR